MSTPSPSSSSSPSDLGVDVIIVPTTPFSGQKPGTSGLRKKVVEFQQPHYLENFVQSILDSLPEGSLKGSTLVVSGDGRFHNGVAIRTILRMFAAHGVGRCIVGQHGVMSTPSMSSVIISRKCLGAAILTASHNPGGPKEDFGIKWNCSNGGPAPESLTDRIFERTKSLSSYRIAKQEFHQSITHVGEHRFGSMVVEIINATAVYADHMAALFDFNSLRTFVQRRDFRFVYDGMHGAGGPFATEIFVKRLGAPPASCVNCVPKEDFGGGHPDPNLTYAHQLVETMGIGAPSHEEAKSDHHHPHHTHHHHDTSAEPSIPDFGAASDGDADRNMILGKKFFVTPSDSVAIIAANYKAIPYFKGGLKGVARSMPTSAALDRVAKAIGVQCYEVPTGWKFFGNLMDDGKLSICGEESFGTGSDHIREKDGIWAILAWLSILQSRNTAANEGSLVSVEAIVREHWKTYGRNFYSRYDYEGVDSKAADNVMANLLTLVGECSKGTEVKWGSYKVDKADEFTYTDPVDKSVSAHQGIRFQFTDGSRIVYRLSGTGSVGATIRVYIEKYENDPTKMGMETAEALKELIDIAVRVSKMQELTGRDSPTVIT